MIVCSHTGLLPCLFEDELAHSRDAQAAKKREVGFLSAKQCDSLCVCPHVWVSVCVRVYSHPYMSHIHSYAHTPCVQYTRMCIVHMLYTHTGRIRAHTYMLGRTRASSHKNKPPMRSVKRGELTLDNQQTKKVKLDRRLLEKLNATSRHVSFCKNTHSLTHSLT